MRARVDLAVRRSYEVEGDTTDELRTAAKLMLADEMQEVPLAPGDIETEEVEILD